MDGQKALGIELLSIQSMDAGAGRRSTEALLDEHGGDRARALLLSSWWHGRVRARGQREMAALRGSERERSRGGRGLASNGFGLHA